MKFSTLLAFASMALAAPTATNDRDLIVGEDTNDAMDAVSEYFNIMAQNIKTSKSLKSAPNCKLSTASLPSSSLPSVSPNLTLLHIAVGRGTQNYTCTSSYSTAVPKAVGAVAALFNATCPSTLYPALDTAIPKMAVYFPMTDWSDFSTHALGPTGLKSSGLHYFQPINKTTATPFFDLRHIGLGSGKVGANATVVAPESAAKGQKGEKAVAWLKLTLKDGQDSAGFKEVYRVNTVGGSPPATCEGLNSTFTVEYSAQYWFFGDKSVVSNSFEL